MIYRAALRSLSRSQWKDLVQQVSYANGFAGEVSDVTASQPETTDEPLHIAYTYKRKDYPDWKEHRVSLPAPNLFSLPPEENGNLPSSFWLGPAGEIQFESRVETPNGYAPDLPSKKDIKQDFAEYHSSYSSDGRVLIGRYRVLIKISNLMGAAVKDYKTFVEKAAEDRDQYIAFSTGQPQTVEEALTTFQNRVRELPDSRDPKDLESEKEAQSAIQLGSTQGAISSLKQAVSVDPAFARAWILLGQMYMATQQKEAAIDTFQRAVKAEPEQAVPYKSLAFALSSLARTKEALQSWQDLAKIAPNDPDVATNIGTLLNTEQRYAEAVPYLESAVKLYPQKAYLQIALGIAYLNTGQDAASKSAFDKVFELTPGASTQNAVAYALAVANKRLEDARVYAEKAVQDAEDESRKVDLARLTRADIARDGRLAAYWDTLGWVHYRLGNLKQAERYLYAAWILMPAPTIGSHLAQVYEKELRKQEALHLYRLVASLRSRGTEDAQAVEDAKHRLQQVHTPATTGGPAVPPSVLAGAELSDNRTITLPKLVSQHASAEFFLLFAPGPKIEDSLFISGSDSLRDAGKALRQAHFKISFPENSSARLVRRGILACYPTTGCSFALFGLEDTRVD